jgi:hypothetical protein
LRQHDGNPINNNNNKQQQQEEEEEEEEQQQQQQQDCFCTNPTINFGTSPNNQFAQNME